MNPVAFKARHDGQQVCFDEPCDLAANTRLLVVPDAEEAFRRDWFEISSQALACASGDDEPDYSSAIIREKPARE